MLKIGRLTQLFAAVFLSLASASALAAPTHTVMIVEPVGSLASSASDRNGNLYSAGQILDLDTVIDPASGWMTAEASDIDKLERMAGYPNKNGASYAFRLDSVRAAGEPGMAVMLIIGMGLIAFGHRRNTIARIGV